MKRIDELSEPPVVGKFYLVPMARELWFNSNGIWPILLPFHEDAEIISFGWDHAHIDRRFLTPRQWECARRNHYYSSAERSADAMPLSRYSTDPQTKRGEARPRPAVEWKRRRCYREITPHAARTVPAHWLPALESAYADCRLKPGLICPHRGAHLGSMPVDADGNVVCPMHGLKWNVATGALVRTP